MAAPRETSRQGSRAEYGYPTQPGLSAADVAAIVNATLDARGIGARGAQLQPRTEKRTGRRVVGGVALLGVGLAFGAGIAAGADAVYGNGYHPFGWFGGENSQSSLTSDETKSNYAAFHPKEAWDWNMLNEAPTPTFDQTLQLHNLNRSDIRTEDLPAPTSWEPALTVVELTEENVDNTRIPLLPGFQYTVAMEDGSIKVFWGGDKNVPEVDVKWGFSARWVPEYQRSEAGHWLNVEDPTELMVRENRFGRYLRNVEQDPNRIDVVYFDRVGPYYTENGNLDLGGWVPPSLDATIAKDYRDAATMFGGIADASMWKHGEAAGDGFLNWSWTSKNATEEWQKDAKWQSVYVPSNINGYVEIWLSRGTTGPNGQPVTQDGPYKFYAGNETDQILQDGRHNVEEFSVHIDRNR